METEQTTAAAGAPEVAAEDEVQWSRAWEWPAWLRPSLPAARTWGPAQRTFALLLLVFFVPGVVGGLGNLGTDLDFARGTGASGGLFAVPTWLRVYYAAQVGLTATGLVLVIGALVLLLWRRAGAALVAVGALAAVAANVTVLVAYVRSHEAPAGSIAEVVAVMVSRLVVVGLAVLLLLPRRQEASPPLAHSFAPPPP